MATAGQQTAAREIAQDSILKAGETEAHEKMEAQPSEPLGAAITLTRPQQAQQEVEANRHADALHQAKSSEAHEKMEARPAEPLEARTTQNRSEPQIFRVHHINNLSTIVFVTTEDASRCHTSMAAHKSSNTLLRLPHQQGHSR